MIESTLIEQSHQGPSALSKAQHETEATIGSSSEADHNDNHTDRAHDISDIHDLDTMMFSYLLYNGEADAEAHVRAFLTTWQTNHVSQRLTEANAKASEIIEFGLSLDDQAVNWYLQHDLATFPT